MLLRATLLFALLLPSALSAPPTGTILGISFATYLGGSQYEYLAAVAVDAAGNAYVAGTTASPDLPTLNALYPAYRGGDYDIVVAKYSPGGKLIYSTYMGGSGRDQAWGIAVDAAGNAYVVGQSSSPDFPLVNAVQQQNANPADAQAFIFKLDPAGQKLLYSTRLGPGLAHAVAIDSTGAAYIAGDATSAFPVVGGLQQTFGGVQDGFVLKLAPGGGQIVYSTFLGGSSYESVLGIALDSGGNAFVTGVTQSTDFPVKNAFQPKFKAAFQQNSAFVAKVNPTGSALLYSTFLGGSTADRASAIAVDPSGNAYVTGDTSSTDFPVANAFQPFLWPLCESGFHSSVYVTKFDPSGSSLLYSTLIGGGCIDEFAHGIAVDSQGSAYITGKTAGSHFPSTAALPPDLAGPDLPGADGGMYVAKLAPSGGALIYASLIGGPGFPDPFAGGASLARPASSNAIALDQAGNAYVAGFTSSSVFPGVNAQQSKFGGVFDGFLLKLSTQSGGNAVPVSSSLAPVQADINSPALTLQVNGSGFLPSSLVNWNDAARPTTFVSATQLNAAISATDLASPGAQWVSVLTPAPGGGTSNFVKFTVNGSLAPVLLGASIQQLTAGGSAATILVGGCFLAGGSVVQWNGTALPTSLYTGLPGLVPSIISRSTSSPCLAPTLLQATIPASALVPGSAQVTIFTPPPGGGTSAAFPITVLPPPVIRPSNSLLNAASYTSSLAPGGLASLFGASFSAGSCNGRATTVCGVSVEMNGIAVPLLFVGPGQVNLQVPWELQGQSAVSIDVLANGVRSPSITTSIASVAPAIFTLNQQGTGQGAILIAGTGIVAGSTGRPAMVGNMIEIYLTGLGPVTNPPATGAQAGTQSKTITTPTVTIGNVSATVSYSGLAPTFVGLYQVNVQIPAGVTPDTSVPVILSINNVASNTVTIAVQ
jgi:uncharacterized protein (TIGR03437 family)